MNEFFKPSEALLSKLDAKKGAKAKYPWDNLPPMMSFSVSDKDCKYTSLITLARRTGERLKKQFKVYYHKDQGVYEVARVDKPEEKLPQMF